jgi:cytochrome c
MKKLTLFLVALFFINCKQEQPKENLYPDAVKEKQTTQQLGQEIFESKGNCFACHKPNQKIVGPSIEEIANIYKEKNGDIVSFLKGNEEPIVDPSQFEVMKTNFAITKNMSDEELNALESYMYSFAK